MSTVTCSVRVLLIENQAESRSDFKNAFKSLGCEILETADEARGFELAEAVLPDCILLDLGASKLHGFDLLRRLRTAAATKNIPVVVFSAFEESRDMAKSLMLGAKDYFGKNFHPPVNIAKRCVEISSGRRTPAPAAPQNLSEAKPESCGSVERLLKVSAL